MIITNRQHLRNAFREMRRNRKLTQAQLGALLNIGRASVSYRESGRTHLDVDAVLQTARTFGYDVALIPARRPGARPTGTGWPA